MTNGIGPQIPFGGLAFNQFMSNPQALAGLGLFGNMLQGMGRPDQRQGLGGGLPGFGQLGGASNLGLLSALMGKKNLAQAAPTGLSLLGLLGR